MMNDYRHMMEQVTLSDQKKEEIMELLEHKTARPRKKRMPRAAKLVLAAALAAGCVLCTAAGIPYQVYNFFTSGSLTNTPEGFGIIGGGVLTLPGPEDSPVIMEDGRLWFVNGKERTDITGLIDENTPYIYEHTDPSTKNKGYVIIGGTVDDFGWAEYVSLDGSSGMMGSNYVQNYVILDGERFQRSELTADQLDRIRELTGTPPEERIDMPCPLEYETVYAPWLEAAMDQLGIERY